jgi:hypothetical protein
MERENLLTGANQSMPRAIFVQVDAHALYDVDMASQQRLFASMLVGRGAKFCY